MANAVRTVSRAAIYCRGGSHEAQGRLCKEEILAHENWTLADTYADAEIPDSQIRDSRFFSFSCHISRPKVCISHFL